MYKHFWLRNLKERGLFWRTRYRSEDNNEIDLTEIALEGVE
jgi:hypothetical protein